jgi:predicted dienelactone hydrolase
MGRDVALEDPMTRPSHRSALLALVPLLLAAPALAGVKAHGPIDPPGALGPWAVGRDTFQVVDPSRDDRTLTVDVWYPVDDADAAGPPSAYDLIFAAIESEVAFDAPAPSAAGPFPLLVFSHGNDGIRFQSFFLMEHLASHGFVVAAPDHAGNTALDILIPGTPFETRDRPLDVSLVITRMLERNAAPGDAFEGRVDPARIGVAGHSFGGFTTLAVGAGFEDVPPDPRVRALMPMSPVSTAFSQAALAGIGVPVLLVGGTADTTTPIDPQTEYAWASLTVRPRYRVDVLEAGHNSFTDICQIGDALLDAGLPPNLLGFLLGNLEEGCAPDLIDVERAHELTNLYATAYLKRDLAGDPRYARYLTRATARKLGDVAWFRVPGCSAGVGLATAAPLALVVGLRGARRRSARAAA